jgi:hypothetical protein
LAFANAHLRLHMASLSEYYETVTLCSRHSKSTSTNDLTKYILSPAQGIIHDKIVTYHQVQSFGLR